MTTRTAGELLFEPQAHEYVLDGRRVVSVTEALRMAGLIDFGAVSPEVLKVAADRGRMAHAYIAHLEGFTNPHADVVLPIEAVLHIEAYEKFKEDTGFTALFAEKAFVSGRYRFAGRPDLIGLIKERLVVIDLKCAQIIQAWVALQLAGYQQLVLEDQGQAPRRYALRLLKDGRYRLDKYNLSSDKADFLACVRIAHWHLRHGSYQL